MRCPICHAEIEVEIPRPLNEMDAQERATALLSGTGADDRRLCPSCGGSLRVVHRPGLDEALLLSHEDACALNSARLVNLYLSRWDDPYAAFLDEACGNGANRDSADVVEGAASDADRVASVPAGSVAAAVWDALDAEAASARETEDWGTLSRLLLEKARYLCSTGGDFYPVQKEALTCQLRDLKARGVARVRIVSGRDGLVCERCAEHAGEILDIDEAIERGPLPVRCDSASRRVRQKEDAGWCRCFYVRAS